MENGHTTTICDEFHTQALRNPEKLILKYINDRGVLTHEVTTGVLDAAAISVANYLRNVSLPVGERVILLCEPGIDFIVSFFGIIYAGLIAVPSSPPINEGQFLKLFKIGRNCKARTVILSAEFYRLIKNTISDIEHEMGLDEPLRWINLSEIPNYDDITSRDESKINRNLLDQLQNEYEKPNIQAKDVAFLQYTSGSTSDPKGVIVTHENILYHVPIIRKAFGYDTEIGDISVTVSIKLCFAVLHIAHLLFYSGYLRIMIWV